MINRSLPLAMNKKSKKIALEKRLKNCKNIITLGVKPNFEDYSDSEAGLIMNADKIYYPSIFYADLFNTMGKKFFPSHQTYLFAQNKIKQTAIFGLLKIPHPKTRIFYGKRQKLTITDYFEFPFIGKIPRGSAMGKGVRLINNKNDLAEYCSQNHVVYIQRYLPSDRDIRVVIIGDNVVHAYWRIASPGEFRSNIAAGGSVSLKPVPAAALELALHTAKKCRWNDVGIDIIRHDDKYYVLEANMKYGKEGFRKFGIDYTDLMERLIDKKTI